MANHKGSEGTVKIGSDTLGEIRGWEFTETAEVIEDSNLGDAAKTFQSGNKTASGSLSCFWDEGDAGQAALVAGASVTLTLYPEGSASGDTYFSCSAIVTSIQRSAAINGMVEASFSWTAAGAVSSTTV